MGWFYFLKEEKVKKIREKKSLGKRSDFSA